MYPPGFDDPATPARPTGPAAHTPPPPEGRTITLGRTVSRKPRASAFYANRTMWNRKLPVSAQKAALRLAGRRRCLVVDILRQGITLGLTSREIRDFADLVTGERDTRMGPLCG